MMAGAPRQFALRPFLAADATALAEIFRGSVDALTDEDHSDAQREAWIAAADDEEAFAQRLAGALTLIATLEGIPVAFASLVNNNRIDMLYVHPAVIGLGVGSMLLDALAKLAAARGAKRLTADVSDSALEFFRKRGFAPQQRNTIEIAGEWVANTTMDKPLAATGGAP